jgi:IS605 OrfB family transposase
MRRKPPALAGGGSRFSFQHIEFAENTCYNSTMKLTAKIKLNPTETQRQMLLETLERANAACNYISQQAWDAKRFGRVPVHKLTYHEVRQQFGLAAQMAVRCIGKVVDAYKLNKKHLREFKTHGAIPYDSRILTYKVDEQSVSIWTLYGRQTISFLAGKRQLELLQHQQGESDLAYIRGEFYLFATCDIEEPEPDDVTEYLGVDLGVTNIATDSDGQIHSARHINNVRVRYAKLRQKLQRKGTKSAKRLLKKRSGRESRFVKDTNHCISKQLVEKAKGTQRGLALEDLTGIRKRATVRKSQRLLLHSWPFSDLGSKIVYKAKRKGVPVEYVDPRNTSRECSVCGCVDKRHRRSQDKFLCISCGHAAHADINAAINIGRRASVNAPYADSELGSNPA